MSGKKRTVVDRIAYVLWCVIFVLLIACLVAILTGAPEARADTYLVAIGVLCCIGFLMVLGENISILMDNIDEIIRDYKRGGKYGNE